jgi:hypothetical protein
VQRLKVTLGLVAKLRAHRLASPFSADHDLVFTTRSGGGFDHRNVGGRTLARAVDRAGLGALHDRAGNVVFTSPTFHALRHSHASALTAAGWDIEEVSSRLGHASVATTQRTYVHAFDAARRSDDRRRRLAAVYDGGAASTEASDGTTPQRTPEANSPVLRADSCAKHPAATSGYCCTAAQRPLMPLADPTSNEPPRCWIKRHQAGARKP